MAKQPTKIPHWLQRVINMREAETVQIYDSEASRPSVIRWLRTLGGAHSTRRHGDSTIVALSWSVGKGKARGKPYTPRESDPGPSYTDSQYDSYDGNQDAPAGDGYGQSYADYYTYEDSYGPPAADRY